MTDIGAECTELCYHAGTDICRSGTGSYRAVIDFYLSYD